ncbi:MAG: pyridoxamine 5'-phosphate oxidase family protein [bacterium]|nr:pyridoxamine 5'-phosphate oxidase family protein [bacterium]
MPVEDVRGAEKITTQEELNDHYGEQSVHVKKKEMTHIDSFARRYIELSPFCAIASSGPKGTTVSPRGDAPGFIRVLDEKTLALPDRPGNNRVDTLTNVLADGQVGLLFLVPGLNEFLRVNGRARITTDEETLKPLSAKGKLPLSALIVDVDAVFFHCGKAVLRSKIWDLETQVERRSFPTLGQIYAGRFAEFDAGEIDHNVGEAYKNHLY